MDKKIITEVKGIVCCRGRVLVLKRSEFETTGAGEWEREGPAGPAGLNAKSVA